MNDSVCKTWRIVESRSFHFCLFILILKIMNMFWVTASALLRLVIRKWVRILCTWMRTSDRWIYIYIYMLVITESNYIKVFHSFIQYEMGYTQVKHILQSFIQRGSGVHLLHRVIKAFRSPGKTSSIIRSYDQFSKIYWCIFP